MSPEAHRRLVELDALSREARAFYEHAAAVLPASALRERCQRLARTKAELVALLAQRLRGGRDPRSARGPTPSGPDPAGAGYAGARVDLDTADLAPLASALQRIEAAMATSCAAQAAGNADADCRRVMAWVLPVLECCLEQVRPRGDGTRGLH